MKIYGYDEINGKIKVNKKEKDILLEIFEKFENGENYSSIINDFDKRDITTEKSKKWRTNRLKRILSNEIYTGNEIYEKFIDYDKYEINKNKVLQITKDNSKKTNRQRFSDANIFINKLVCDECGSLLTRRVQAYGCRNHIEIKHERKLFQYVKIDALEINMVRLFLKLQTNNNPILKNVEETKQRNKVKNLDRKIKYAISENENMDVIKNLIIEKTEATYILYSQIINPTEIILEKLKETEKIKALDKKYFRELIEKIICYTDGTYEFHFINKAHIKVKDGRILKG